MFGDIFPACFRPGSGNISTSGTVLSLLWRNPKCASSSGFANIPNHPVACTTLEILYNFITVWPSISSLLDGLPLPDPDVLWSCLATLVAQCSALSIKVEDIAPTVIMALSARDVSA